MDNARGNEIAEEMKSKFKDFEIIEFRHDGKLFEYPGIKRTAELSLEYNEPILYLHTKGAGNNNTAQPWVRSQWYKWWHKPWYNKWHDGLIAIMTGPTGQTWFNSFIIYPNAAKIILDKMEVSENRYYYEELPHNIDVPYHSLFQNVEPLETSNYLNDDKLREVMNGK
jgi:hypothetical protein